MANQTYSKRIFIIGVPDMVYAGMNLLLNAGVNIVGVMGPKKDHNTYSDFKSYVLSNNLNFIDYDDLKEPQLLEKIKELKVDLGVVFSFNHKFPKEFIELFPNGILNLHPSLLPNYRGGNPYSRVIMNGEQESGVTIHFISENFDEGDLVLQIRCPVEVNETMGSLFAKTNYLGVRLMLTAITEFENKGTLPRVPQPKGEFIKAKNLSDSEMYVDFNKTAVEIERHIRALNPYIPCYTYYKGQAIKLYKASVAEINTPDNAINGEIIKIDNDKVYIKTGNGAICPEILQFGGYFVGDTKDFISIAKPKIGDIFENG